MDNDKKMEDQVERWHRFTNGVAALAKECQIDDETAFLLFGLMGREWGKELLEAGTPEPDAMTAALNQFLSGMGARMIPTSDLPPEVKESFAAAMGDGISEDDSKPIH